MFETVIQTIYALTPLIILVLEILHYVERKDLYSRIMAKSLPEFTAYTETKKAKVEPVKTELVRL